jgi:hypothetical protein
VPIQYDLDMKNIHQYLPKNKDDISKIDELEKLPYSSYKPILKDLFEWVQDMNWPVAEKVAPLLIKAGKDTIPIIKDILRSDDVIWGYWVLQRIVSKMSIEVIQELERELKAISANPTPEQKAEELDILCMQVLKKQGNVKNKDH